ncbi:Autocrine proliferation repressor protein A [Diplonema papillatum]|nr:Autocrine proliferation repressor protein A [Diplonema papillatum]
MAGLLLLASVALATPLDDYINKADPVYQWHDTGIRYRTKLLGTGYVLNVTSQQWLDETKAAGPSGALWTHQIVVVVPRAHTKKDKGVLWVTGSCNNDAPPGNTAQDVLLVDAISATTGSIAAALFQVPNCPIVYSADPTHASRREDAMIAFAWSQFLLNTSQPEWLPRLPMAKAGFKAMQAVAEFAKEENFGVIDSWFVSGASKRGWTTWDIGYAQCNYDGCPNVVGIGPVVPIAPAIHHDMHHMFKAYGGWTWAFHDYYKLNLTMMVDTPQFAALLSIVDPFANPESLQRLARLPKHVIVASNDEFMMMEWTNYWWPSMPGEKYLTIVSDAEHSLGTNLPEAMESLFNTINSVFMGSTKRPQMESIIDFDTGVITLTIPSTGPQPTKVVMQHADTVSTINRDFRWTRVANNVTGECELPEISMKPSTGGANCLVPIFWHGVELTNNSNTYTASVPARAEGWTGFFIKASFESDTGLDVKIHLTTPGLVWPQKYPYADCTGDACLGTLV